MPSVEGYIKYTGARLIGAFSVDGGPRYLSVDCRPNIQPFERRKATLTYDNVAQLLENCKWKGSAGRDDIQMNFDEGVCIVAQLVTQRSSAAIRGTGTWSAVDDDTHHLSVNTVCETRNTIRNVSTGNSSLQDPVQVDRTAKIAREQQLLRSRLPIIAIFGQSGVGKSTFINLVTSEQQATSRGLHSCTRDVNVVAAKVGGKSIVIIDTPGIDDTRTDVKEGDVLTKIANFLGDMGERKIYVTGVLFLHRISDNRFSHTAQRISAMLKSLCGDAAMPHLMLCATMWDKVSPQEGNNALKELYRIGVWKEMMDMGAATTTMSNVSSNAKSDAERILCELIKNAPTVELAIQHEMVTEGREADDTSAGRVLDADQKKQDESDQRVKKTRKQKSWRRFIGCVIQ